MNMLKKTSAKFSPLTRDVEHLMLQTAFLLNEEQNESFKIHCVLDIQRRQKKQIVFAVRSFNQFVHLLRVQSDMLDFNKHTILGVVTMCRSGFDDNCGLLDFDLWSIFVENYNMFMKYGFEGV